MAEQSDEIRFDLRMRPAADGRFEVLLRLYRGGLFASETSIAVLKEGKARLILRMADQQLARLGYREFLSELPAALQFDAKAA
ncbi:hypothetical protein [Lichenibacterium dinghuense]|uniref:hypothetical protein n=1 Tax=Lichenibacterium dinghuense TaxID=2895977 RepID=UPI001F2BA7D8|nr:hypothetical protein [Lichenibacterium sp. 6Y81]